jgi:cell division protein FtsI (penicillin-binding protein 3)
MLTKVTTADGTAIKAAIPGFLISGKTGTSQKAIFGQGYRTEKHIASFVGFAQNVKPRYVVFVMVDEPKFPYFGGDVAAPIFRKIMMSALARAGVKPNPQLITPVINSVPVKLGKVEPKSVVLPPISRVITHSGDVLDMPNLIGASAREVLDVFDRRPVTLSLSGSGVVVEQSPAAGSKFKKGDSVLIRLDRASM